MHLEQIWVTLQNPSKQENSQTSLLKSKYFFLATIFVLVLFVCVAYIFSFFWFNQWLCSQPLCPDALPLASAAVGGYDYISLQKICNFEVPKLVENKINMWRNPYNMVFQQHLLGKSITCPMTEGTPLSIALRLETLCDSFWQKGQDRNVRLDYSSNFQVWFQGDSIGDLCSWMKKPCVVDSLWDIPMFKGNNCLKNRVAPHWSTRPEELGSFQFPLEYLKHL